MSKFKIGDRVKILPSAVHDGVSSKAFNQLGHIDSISLFNCYTVKMDKPELNNGSYSWAVTLHNIYPAIKVGQQLLLWDDL